QGRAWRGGFVAAGAGSAGRPGSGWRSRAWDEDGLDGVVAIFADGVGAGTGGIDALGAVALGEPEDALGAPEPIEGAIPEQGVDEQRAGGADLGGPLVTRSGRLQEEMD